MTTTLVLINPFTASGRDVKGLLSTKNLTSSDNINGKNLLPSVDDVRRITESGTSIVILDNMISMKLAPSVLDYYYGARTLNELKKESMVNYKLILVDANVNYYNWNLNEVSGDLRDSESPVIYVDYTKYYKLPPNLNDELVVMATVEDFKPSNRKYLRNVDPSELIRLVGGGYYESTAWCDPYHCPSISDGWEVYEPLMRSLLFYVLNRFHDDDPDIPYGMIETNIIKDSDVKSYAFVMSQPIFKCFIHYNNLLPDLPKYDKLNYVGTGKTPTVMMTNSNQYRRLMTEEIAAFFKIAMSRTRGGLFEDEEIDFLDADFIKKVIELMERRYS